MKRLSCGERRQAGWGEMDANVLFGKALGLGDGWKVVESEMDVEGRQLKLRLDFAKGLQFACPECGEYCQQTDGVTFAKIFSAQVPNKGRV